MINVVIIVIVVILIAVGLIAVVVLVTQEPMPPGIFRCPMGYFVNYNITTSETCCQEYFGDEVVP